jgi:hypothetical protein
MIQAHVGLLEGRSLNKTKALYAAFEKDSIMRCQRRSKNASAGRSKNTSAMLAGRPRTGGLFFGHQAWVGLSTEASALARRERRLL